MDIAGEAQSGVVAVVWLEQATGQSKAQVQASVYSGGSWGAQLPVSVDPAPNSLSSAPQIAVHPGGGAAAIWIQKVGADLKNNVYASWISPGGSTWAAPVKLSDDINASDIPVLRADSQGAYAVWRQRGSSDTFTNLYASNAAAGSSAWTAQVMVSNDVASIASTGLAIDPSGGGLLALWTQKGTWQGIPDQYANVYTSRNQTLKGPWDPPERVSEDIAATSSPRAVIYSKGLSFNGIAVFEQAASGTIDEIYASILLQ